VSDADVVRRIAAAHGLTPEVQLDGPTYPSLAQLNQSDLAFLRERMAAIDAELWVDDRTLYAQMRASRRAGSASFTYKENLLEFSVLADLAEQRTAVHVCGWDVSAKGAILGQAFTARRERIVSAVPLSKAEAKRMAEARYRERARRFVRGSGTVNGDVRIRVGASIELHGLGPLFDGNYYVTLARHSFDLHSGFRSSFEVERPMIGP